MNIEARVNKIIESNPVTLFVKTDCPYSRRAREMMDQLKVKYQAVELDKEKDGSQMWEVLKEATGRKTVPYVWIGRDFYGGADDVERLNKSGELTEKLRKERAITA